MANIYKPKYKICYQTKNKVWIYKNSRLRNFYNIRNKIIIDKRPKKIKQKLVTKNMKWTVARRLMVPYTKTRNYFVYNYKNIFFLKQQLKKFYGKVKEHHLRSIFKNTWAKEQHFKKNVFISSLEQRLDMVFFRMRLLPTIYSCHQFIDHKGILVNNKLVSLPSYRVKIGDIVSIPQDVWLIFYNRIFYKLKKRFFFNTILVWHNKFLLKKMNTFMTPKSYFFYIKILKQSWSNKKLYKILKKHIYNQFFIFDNFNYKNPDFIKLANKNKNFFKRLNILLIQKIYFQIKQMTFKNLKKLIASPLDQKFYKLFHKILTLNYNVSQSFNLIYFILYKQLHTFIFQQNSLTIKNSRISAEQKIKLIYFMYIETNNKINEKFKNYESNKLFLMKNFRLSIKKFYKKFLNLEYNSLINNSFIYNKRILNIILKLNNQKVRKDYFKDKEFKHHWYTPSYLEVDYKTLRASFIFYPEPSNIYYGFPCSFDKLVSFYKERAL